MPAFKAAPTPGLEVYNIKDPVAIRAFKTYVKTELVEDLSDRLYKIIWNGAQQNPVMRWNTDHPDIDLKAKIRRFIYDSMPDIVQQCYYEPITTAHCGYEGWYEFPNFGCLAFFTPKDGENPEDDPLFRW